MGTTRYSSRVCLTCKSGKRKCDKVLPVCSRCARLQLTCVYEGADDIQSHAAPSLHQALFKSKSSNAWLRSAYTAMQKDRSLYLKNANTYFGTVHKWLPLVNKETFKARWEKPSFEPTTEDCLLLLSMCLIIQRPDEQQSPSMMETEQYHAVKHLFQHAFTDSISSPLVAVLQAGVLLATYEYGHGMVHAAHSTVYSCISAAITLGLHQSKACSCSRFSAGWKDQGEGAYVWWALVISERIFCLWRPDEGRLPITRVVNEIDLLQDLDMPESFADSNNIPAGDRSPEANFYRQVQSSILIGHILEQINSPDPDQDESKSAFRILDSRLRRAIEINLGAEANHLGSASEALAMNRSSLIVLHQWQYDRVSKSNHRLDSMQQSRMVLESMTTIMVDTVHEFLPRIYAGWPKSHHPQGTQSVFQAANVLLSLLHTTTDRSALDELKEMLTLQSCRWRIASRYSPPL
ncbi:hypothetical protein BDV23DRAFT_174674 [Aspergillus alliaceus]|uniref:Zn(2)-C6 fungal-type domain-containing protein n=1 Tax=Petromyces alliaceus TaxID=209559 RepID=A0A5N7C020_PETAA|nr:hypothetical protein BDV23DRAFT_174674 [Aspergillus alliaceus]